MSKLNWGVKGEAQKAESDGGVLGEGSASLQAAPTWSGAELRPLKGFLAFQTHQAASPET